MGTRAKTDREAQVGRAIRQRRKALGKTLVEVAEETELTTGFISQIERGISSPSLSSFMRIAAALHTSVEQLLNVPEEFNTVAPKGERQSYRLGAAGRLYERLGPGFPGALMYPSIIHRPPGHVSEVMCHKGESFCYLISGQLEYHIADRTFVVNAGDAFHHDTSDEHYSKVTSDTESVELWVNSSPIKQPS
jgi:transcriptional regulator with XRE-family HTH domain